MSYGDLECSAYMIARQEREADAAMESPYPKELGRFNIEDDDEEGTDNHTTVSVWLVAADESDPDDVNAWVERRFPAERCQHDYDCCGRKYAGRATWSYGPEFYRPDESKCVVVRQPFRRNI